MCALKSSHFWIQTYMNYFKDVKLASKSKKFHVQFESGWHGPGADSHLNERGQLPLEIFNFNQISFFFFGKIFKIVPLNYQFYDFIFSKIFNFQVLKLWLWEKKLLNDWMKMITYFLLNKILLFYFKLWKYDDKTQPLDLSVFWYLHPLYAQC